jgi:hypothetical protein
MATKGVYHNGVYIGDVEATGDLYEDLRITRAFLDSKGIKRAPTGIVRRMFDQATAFTATAEGLHRQMKATKVNPLAVAPFVVTISFAVELYLKALARSQGTTLTGHDLGKLWRRMPGAARELALREAARMLPPGAHGATHMRDHLDRRRATRQVALDAFQPCLQIPIAPARHLHAPNAELPGNLLVLQALRSQQNDPRALRKPHARAPGARQPRQLRLLLIGQSNRRCNPHLPPPVQAHAEHCSRNRHIRSYENRTLR